MVVHIKSGKRENGKSFCCNLYRKRSTIDGSLSNFVSAPAHHLGSGSLNHKPHTLKPTP